MLIKVHYADPAAVLDYYIDWGPWLAGDTLVTSLWEATGGTVELGEEMLLGAITGIWAGPGLVGELIDLTNHILTAEGREDERTIRLVMKD